MMLQPSTPESMSLRRVKPLLSLLAVTALATSFGACSVLGSGSSLYRDGRPAAVAVAPDPRLPGPQGYYKVGTSYTIKGITYTPEVDPDYNEVGAASWYGKQFHGLKTANGEIFDMNQLTAAHKTMPLPSYVRVTNMENGKAVVVRVNDRGPFAHDRIIDLSKETAREIGMLHQGVGTVRVEYLGLAETENDAAGGYYSAAVSGNGVLSQTTVAAAPAAVTPSADTAQQSSVAAIASPTGDVQQSGITTPGAHTYNLAALDANRVVSQVPETPDLPPQNAAPLKAPEPSTPSTPSTTVAVATTPSAQDTTLSGTPSSLAPNSGDTSQFYVQAGAFSDPVNALKVRNVLRPVGAVEIAQRTIAGDRTLYIVRVGPFHTRDNAATAIEQIRDRVTASKPYVVAP